MCKTFWERQKEDYHRAQDEAERQDHIEQRCKDLHKERMETDRDYRREVLGERLWTLWFFVLVFFLGYVWLKT